MAGLRDLKRRIVAVKSVQSATEAMSSIAGAKLTMKWMALEHARAFAGNLEKAVYSVAVEPEDVIKNPRYFVFGSDQGLCGSLNSLTARHTRNLLKASEKNEIDAYDMVLVGEKVKGMLSTAVGPQLASKGVVTNLQKDLTWRQVSEATSDLIEANPEPGQNTYIYQKMKNQVQSEIVQDNQPNKEQIAAYYGADLECEGDNDVFENLTEFLTASSMFRVINESETSELASRQAAMTNASKAAGDMVEGLELVFRKVRQAKVTTEIIEICTGAEAVQEDD